MLMFDESHRPMYQQRWQRPRSMRLTVTIFCVCFVSAATGRAQTPEFRPQVVIPRAFPAIKDAPIITAAEADRLLAEQELVIGVVVNGKARAYPINMLTGPQREIINDSLGGRAIAATW